MEEYNFDKLYLASFYEIKIQEKSRVVLFKISKIRICKKIIMGYLFSYSFFLAIVLILSAIKSLIS